MSNTIFVQIASYKDPQLLPTLKNITENAHDPQNLKITVCWQHGEEENIEDFLDFGIDVKDIVEYTHTETDGSESTFEVLNTKFNDADIKFISVDYTKTRGTCWARNLIQQFYNSEKYTLQLDSHHRFVENWDTLVIDMLESLREESKKPILTGYIPSFNPDNDPSERSKTPYETNFDRFIPEGAVFFIPSAVDNWKELDKPFKARFFSAHFAFADGDFALNVQHDPDYFFHGEEISLAVRAFTHGYDLYTPHRIVAWHEYTRDGRTKVWDDHTTIAKKTKGIEKDWIERNNICHKRNRILFGMDGEDSNQIDFGKYGFGNVRTLREYEEYAGIIFKLRGVQQYTLDRNRPPNPPIKDEKKWLESFLTSVDVRICVNKSEFGELPDDINFCFVGVHDKEGVELHRKDLTREEFLERINSPGGWIDYPYICILDQTPYSYTLWPHSESEGWLIKIDKVI